jgi:hypothetical protein
LAALLLAVIVLSIALYAVLGDNGNPADKYGPSG